MRMIANKMTLKEAIAKMNEEKEIKVFDKCNEFVRFNSLSVSKIKPKYLDEVVEFRVTPTKYDIKFVNVCYAEEEKRS